MLQPSPYRHVFVVMNQLFLRSAVAVVFASWLAGLAACKNEAGCRDLAGAWTDREGQELVFLESGQVLWLTPFGSQTDTLTADYRLDCRKDPVTIDFLNFRGGPYANNVLYGIIEWTGDSSIRLLYEPGSDERVRPEAFDGEQPLQFVRSK
jgi:hypothetical protein